MFSKLRRSKAEKPAEPAKLRGMPALKQMRSSKRIDNFSAKSPSAKPPSPKPPSPKLTEFERLRKSIESQSTPFTTPTPNPEPILRHESPTSVNLIPNYKRPLSANLEQPHRQQILADHAYNVDKLKTGGPVSYGDKKNGVTGGIPEENEEREDQDSPVTPWRISKGDSGYKSKDENSKDEKQKAKKSRKKGKDAKPRGKGLHTIKQQRKASREYCSNSMRALTPKERESILFLEGILKEHSDGEESGDDVFDSDSSNDDIEEVPENSHEKSNLDETTDFGYASINDHSRKYSMESASSVGSIIDLVGNLPDSSSPKSQTYISIGRVDDDITDNHFKYATEEIHTEDVTNGNRIHDFTNGFDDAPTYAVLNKRKNNVADRYSDASLQSDNATMRPEDVITELDDVIHSFATYSSDEEEEQASSRRIDANDPSERSEKDRKKKKKKQGVKGDEERSGSILPEEHEQYDQYETPHAVSEEPVYAQVQKKNKVQSDVVSRRETTTELLEPPLAFGNQIQEVESVAKVEITKMESGKDTSEVSDEPTSRSSRAYWKKIEEQSHPPESHTHDHHLHPKYGHTSLHTESRDHRQTTTTSSHSSRPASDASDYASQFRPQVSKLPPSMSRMPVSQSMLNDSSRGLRHVDVRASKGKVLRVDPDHDKIEEGERLENPIQNERKSATREFSPNLKAPKDFQNERTPERREVSPTLSAPKPFQNERTSERLKYRNFQSVVNALPTTPEMEVDHNRNPVQMRSKPHIPKKPPGRPVSLNLDQNGNLKLPSNERPTSVVIRPYSSFRQDKPNPKQDSSANSKPRPFVITPLKKPIQLY